MFGRPDWRAILAVAGIAAGFAAMGLAWNKAASIDYAQGQIPYVISGGFVGLALVGVGIGLMVFESARRSRQKLEERFSELAQNLMEAMVSSNGHSVSGSAKGQVVIGASSYHRPDCRLVEGKENPIYAQVEVAVAQGLVPCRVCNPSAVGEPKPSRRK
jgi:hypothetical protein